MSYGYEIPSTVLWSHSPSLVISTGVLLSISVTACLFWKSSTRSQLTALIYFLVATGIPIGLPFVTSHLLPWRFGIHSLILGMFAPFPVYPVAQGLIAFIAIAGALGFSPTGGARFSLSAFALTVGIVVLTFIQSKQDSQHPDDDTDQPRMAYFFLDCVFLASASLVAMLAPCLMKNADERTRLVQGCVIIYDLYKLIVLVDTENKSIIIPHAFATPVLLAVNAFAFCKRRQPQDSWDQSTDLVTKPAEHSYPTIVRV